jgi:hypothetical protein
MLHWSLLEGGSFDDALNPVKIFFQSRQSVLHNIEPLALLERPTGQQAEQSPGHRASKTPTKDKTAEYGADND